MALVILNSKQKIVLMGVKVEDDWRYKKVRSARASKSAFAYKINRQLKIKAKSSVSYGFSTKAPYSREVIVKITGGARSKKGIRGAVYYMSKEGQLEIIDSNGILYRTKEEVEDAVRLLQENVPTQNPQKKEKKLTQNIVFSASNMVGVTREDMLKTAALTLKEKYPDNYFVMSYHENTKNPHVHVVLNIHKDTGERINIRKSDLRATRESFCQNLINFGYDVKATRKYGQKLDVYQELLSPQRKNTYEVVDFGTASYQLDKDDEKNGYLVYKTSHGKEVTIWGKELLDEIACQKIQQGDSIKLKKVGHTIVKVPVYGNDRKTILSWKAVKRNQWQIERADKDLNFSQTDKTKEIKLDSPEQAVKQLEQREKFNHEKKLLLDPSYRETFKRESELRLKAQNPKIRF